MADHSVNRAHSGPPIELVAARMRDLRQTAAVLASSPDVIVGTGDELRRIVADYDELLLIAARQVGLDLTPVVGELDGLSTDLRRQIERRVVAEGWVLDA